MKRTSKALALLLALVMVLSCISVQAFAATEENVKQYGEEAGGYLAFGDSISRGYGTTGYYKHEADTFSGEDGIRTVEGSFIGKLAAATGYNPTKLFTEPCNYWPVALPGQTLGATMDLFGVEDGLDDTKFDFPYYNSLLKWFGYEGSLDGVKGQTYDEATCGRVGSVIKLTEDANLITVQLGMCDVFYRAFRIATNGGLLANGFDDVLSDTEKLTALATEYINEMITGFNYFNEYYPQFISMLRNMNEDATIVVIGAFNMLRGVTLDNDSLVQVGNVISVITDQMNEVYEKTAKDYGCLYVDVSNTECYAAEQGWSIMSEEFLKNTDPATHPSQNGHDYIYRQILSVLPEENPNGNKWASTDIVVDLGRFTEENIQKVYVDGAEFTKGTGVGCYEMDGYNLVCHYGFGYATTLRVQMADENGKIVTQIYSLSYQNGGYVAELVRSDNDTEQTNSKFVQFFKDIFQKIADFFENLFK